MNLTQTPMLGIPILGARYGMAKAAGALLGAAGDFATGRGTVAKGKLNEDERWALGKFYESGLIDRTRSHDLAGVGNTGVRYSPLRARVMSIISWGFHATEVANREVTALAAYRLARQAGLSSEAALDEAHDMTWKIHFDYSNSSRARFMQNDAAKLLLVFQNFSLNMYYRLFRDIHQSLAGETGQARREARLQLAGMMGMMTLMGGVTGLFGFHVLMALAGMFFDDKDDPMDFETEMRRHVIDLFGNDVGAMILNGVPGTLLNVDLTSRIGMPDFFVRAPTDPNLDGRDWYQQMLVNALGVVPSTLLNGLDGFSLIRDGNTFRGLELLAPKALKDAMQAYRFANEGVTTRRQDEIVSRDAFGAWGTISKILGFTSATVAEAYDRKSALSNAQATVMDQRSVLLNQLAMAIEMGDDETRRRVLDRIRTFNANPIHRAVAITSETIKRSLAARRRRRQNVQDGVSVSNRALGSQLEDLLP